MISTTHVLRTSLAATLCLGLLAGCASPSTPATTPTTLKSTPKKTGGTGPTAGQATPVAKGTVSGTVTAPIASSNGASYGVLAAEGAAAADAEVELVAGNSTTVVATTKTDKNGKYKFENVPSGQTYQVRAGVMHKGKKVQLKTLAGLTGSAADAPVSLATTFVATDLLKGVKGKYFKAFKADSFLKLVGVAETKLDEDSADLLGDEAAMASFWAQFEADMAQLEADMDALMADLDKLGEELAADYGEDLDEVEWPFSQTEDGDWAVVDGDKAVIKNGDTTTVKDGASSVVTNGSGTSATDGTGSVVTNGGSTTVSDGQNTVNVNEDGTVDIDTSASLEAALGNL